MSLSHMSKISLLKKLGFMVNQKEEVFQFLAHQVDEIVVTKGQNIFTKGDKGGAAYIIAKGCIQIHDQEHVFIELEKGKSFGEYALVDADTRSASATATKDTVVLQCTQTHLRLVEEKFQVKIIDAILSALQNMKKRMLVKDLLEEELTRQKIQIEEQKKELESLNATKDKFFSIIAHDLKYPVASLIGASDFLVSSSNDLSKEQMANFLKIINSSAKQGYRLLENLLEWSRTQRGLIKPEFLSIPLFDSADSSILFLKQRIEDKKHRIVNNIDKDFKVLADVNLLLNIFNNLLNLLFLFGTSVFLVDMNISSFHNNLSNFINI